MHQALLGQAQRQVAVAVVAGPVELDVARAVHRLQPQRPAFLLGEEHVVAVLVPVPGLLPQVDRVDDRRAHLAVAALPVELAPERCQLVPDHHPPRMPERPTRRDVAHVEQVELAAEPAVVAAAGLLQPLEVSLEVALREEGGAVDAGQHGLVGVTTPVGAGGREQLEGLDRRGGLQVRAAAQVLEAVLDVQADIAGWKVLDQLQLVRLVLGRVAVDQLLLVHSVLAHERVLRAQDAAHLLLDPGQVVGRDRGREVEVVVEAVGDGRADRDLGARPQVQDGFGHHVCGRVAQHGQRLGIAVGDDPHPLAFAHREPQIAGLPVDLHGNRGLRQAVPDRLGHVEAARPVGKLDRRPVG